MIPGSFVRSCIPHGKELSELQYSLCSLLNQVFVLSVSDAAHGSTLILLMASSQTLWLLYLFPLISS